MTYKKTSAYIETVPSDIKFSLPFSDNSGEWLAVTTRGTMNDIVIRQDNDYINIPVDKIDWLRQVLKDIKDIIELKLSIEMNDD